MLAHVAKNTSKDFNILITAHVYSVCPTAIPTLPTPDPSGSEQDLMENLGMQKDKNGEYESFDRFLARTEVSFQVSYRHIANIYVVLLPYYSHTLVLLSETLTCIIFK